MTASMPVREANPRWALRIGLLSDVGRSRHRNEDAMAAFLPYHGENPEARGEALFLVADGMGGHEAGDMASAFVAQVVRDWFTQLPPGDAFHETSAEFRHALRSLLEAANQDLVELARKEGLVSGAGSTATVACLRGGRLHIAHVGDTRLYRLRGGRLEQLTEDHSWVAEQQRAGLLNADEVANHPQRHMLTECLGVGPTVRVFTDALDVNAGDQYLLCSDGLHGPLHDEAIARVLSEETDPQQAARRLVALANDHSGPDNITAVVVHVLEPAAEVAATTRSSTTAGSAMAITVPGIIPTPADLVGTPARSAAGRAASLHVLLLLLGVMALGAAATVGERTLRSSNASAAAAPADSVSAAHPSSRFVPAEASADSTGGRAEGGSEQ